MGIGEMLRRKSKTKAKTPEIGEVAKARKSCVMVDHPQQGETITAPYYTFRIGTTGEMERVEISIDQRAWQPCRNAVGYWWYDWSAYQEGHHQITGRAQAKDGQAFASEPRKFRVSLGLDKK